MVMADIANASHDYVIWSGLPNMAARARISEASAHRAIAELLDTGWIEDTGQRSKWGTRIFRWNLRAGLGSDAPDGIIPAWPPVTDHPSTTMTSSEGLTVTPPPAPGGLTVVPGGLTVRPGGLTVRPELEVPEEDKPSARAREARAPAGNPAGPPAPEGRPNRDTRDPDAPPGDHRSVLGAEALADARQRALRAMGARRERLDVQAEAHRSWCADRFNPLLFEPSPAPTAPPATAPPAVPLPGRLAARSIASLFAGVPS